MKTRNRRANTPAVPGRARGSSWITVGALVAYTTLGGGRGVTLAEPAPETRPAPDSGGGTATHTFDVPAGTLAAALRSFREQSGLEVLVRLNEDGLRAVNTRGVSGVRTASEALRELLADTGIVYRFSGEKTVTLDLPGHRESVEVTARGTTPSSPKYNAPLRDIPQTLMVIPSAMIEEQNATTLRDVLRNVTGISLQAGEGGVPAGDNLSIRGFSARTDIFVDGVRDFGGYSRDPFNVEQVEVTKGPASAYAGRGSTGGSINLSTKAPHLTTLRSASLGAGSDAYKRGTVDVNQPVNVLGLEGTALRLNAMWTEADTPGRDVVDNARWGVAPSLAIGAGTATRVTLSYSYLEQDNTPDYGLPWVPADNVPLAAYRNQAPPVSYGNFYGLAERDYETTETGLASAQIERDLGRSARVRNLLRYGNTRRDSIVTAPRFQSAASTDIRRTDWKSRDQDDTILANALTLNAGFRAAGVEHGVVVGGEIARETSVNHTRVETAPSLPLTDLYTPDPNDRYTGGLQRNGALTDGAADSLAVFAIATVKVGPRLELTGGLRWDRFRVDYDSIDTAGQSTPFARTDEMLSWRAGVVYKPRANGSVYAGAGTSLNPSAEGLSLTAATATLEPEKSRSYEIGTKWDVLDRRLGLTAALFRTEKTNARTPGVNPGDAPTVLQGEHRVDGLDVGVTGRITRRWSVLGGYTYMDSEIVTSHTAAEIGKELGNTPRHSFSLWTTCQTALKAEVGGGVRYVGDRFNNNANARLAPSYWLIDAMAAYPVNTHLTLRLNATNLADERYIDRIGGGHFIPGEGRMVALNAALKF